MTTKNLVMLTGVAAVLAGAAYFLGSGSRPSAPKLAGKTILPAFNVADVTAIEIGKKVKLVAGNGGWTIESLYGYPADREKIVENVLKLQELKVGQVARGRKIEKPVTIDLQGAGGKPLASLPMGETHMRKATGQAAMYGGSHPDGRYILFQDQVVLVKDALEAFDGDPKKWCNTRIASVSSSDVKDVVYAKGSEKVELSRKDSSWELKGLGPKEELDSSKTYSLDSALSYLDFASVADPKKEATYGFATGSVYTATLKNGITYTAKIGDKAASGDRYVKLAAAYKAATTNKTEIAACEKTVKDFNEGVGKWVYTVSSYSAESMCKTRKDLVKAKEEPKKDEAKKDAPKAEAKKDAPKADAPKAEAKKEAPKADAPKAETKKEAPKAK